MTLLTAIVLMSLLTAIVLMSLLTAIVLMSLSRNDLSGVRYSLVDLITKSLSQSLSFCCVCPTFSNELPVKYKSTLAPATNHELSPITQITPKYRKNKTIKFTGPSRAPSLKAALILWSDHSLTVFRPDLHVYPKLVKISEIYAHEKHNVNFIAKHNKAMAY